MALDVDDSMSDSSSESSFSSDASIDNNNLADDAQVGSNEPDVAIDDPGEASDSSDLLPTDASAGVWRKNAHFVSLEALLGGVAIAPRYPTPAAGPAGVAICPGVIPDPPPLSRVVSPFLPLDASPTPMDSEEYTRIRNHWRWWERLRGMSEISTRDSFARATDNALRNKIRASMLRNEPFTGSSSSKRMRTRRPGRKWARGRRVINWETSVYQQYRRLLVRNPFGPENLYSSSCLRSFVGTGGNVCLAHTDYSRAVKIKTITRSAWGNDTTPLRYRVEIDWGAEAELLDYDLSEDERVYGVAHVASASSSSPLIALKYRRAISLVDVEGDMKGNLKFKDDLADIAELPAQDSLASVDCGGIVTSIDRDTMGVVAVWEGALRKHVRGYRWACLLEGSLDDPWTVGVGTRKAVALFDARRGGGGSGAAPRLLCQSARGEPLDEIITAVARSSASPCSAFYVATTHGLHLLDERSPRNPVTTWRHLCGAESAVVGCSAAVAGGVEYVATHARNGDVQVMANDWRHAECRVEEFSCQNWRRAEYPMSLSDGRMQHIPSAHAILNAFPFDSDVPVSHLVAPWVGMTMVTEHSDELSLLASNAAGELFCCDLGLREEDEADGEEGASGIDPFSFDGNRGDVGRKTKSRSSAWDCPLDFNDTQRDWVKRWADHCEETAYLKIIRPTAVYEREPGWAEYMAKNNRVLHPIRKSWKYEQPEHDADDVARIGHKKALKGKTHFKNAPMLKAVNEKDWQHDAQARRVLAIFAGENPWKDDYEMATKHARSADPESLFNCGSRRKRTWSGMASEEAAASESETLTGLRREEEDRNVALDSVLAGIEARMNSTQETPAAAGGGGGGALGEDSFVAATEGTAFDSTPLTASESPLKSHSGTPRKSMLASTSSPASAKKRKKKKLVGF